MLTTALLILSLLLSVASLSIILSGYPDRAFTKSFNRLSDRVSKLESRMFEYDYELMRLKFRSDEKADKTDNKAKYRQRKN